MQAKRFPRRKKGEGGSLDKGEREGAEKQGARRWRCKEEIRRRGMRKGEGGETRRGEVKRGKKKEEQEARERRVKKKEDGRGKEERKWRGKRKG